MAYRRPQIPYVQDRLEQDFQNDERVLELDKVILNNPNHANNLRSAKTYLVFLTAQNNYDAYLTQSIGIKRKKLVSQFQQDMSTSGPPKLKGFSKTDSSIPPLGGSLITSVQGLPSEINLAHPDASGKPGVGGILDEASSSESGVATGQPILSDLKLGKRRPMK